MEKVYLSLRVLAASNPLERPFICTLTQGKGIPAGQLPVLVEDERGPWAIFISETTLLADYVPTEGQDMRDVGEYRHRSCFSEESLQLLRG